MKTKREWLSPDGIRCVELEGIDGPCVDGRDLGKWLLSIDPSEIDDVSKRARFERFQREAVALQLAAQYRLAVEMLEEFGAKFSDETRTLKPAAVRR